MQLAAGVGVRPGLGAWANVIAISPPALYAAEPSICGTIVRSQASAAARPARLVGRARLSQPSWQRSGTM